MLRKYTWGRDLSGLRATGTDGASLPTAACGGFSPVAADLRVGRSAGHGVPALQGAGGTLDPIASRQGQVGGLLAVWDSNDTPSNTATDLTYVFFYDATLDTRPAARRLGSLRDRGYPPAGVCQGQACNVSPVVDVEDLANWQSLGLTGPGDWHASRLAARYEYDPYGNLAGPDTNSDGVFDSADDAGPHASRNPFRFSTKYFDDETGFGYWGYRYYGPKLGRWLSRDPIGELGGNNLYAFTANSPTVRHDPDGQLWTWACCTLCVGSIVADLGGGVAGCLWGCLEYAAGRYSVSECFYDCIMAYLKDRMDHTQAFNIYKSVIEASSCVCCGIRVVREGPSPPAPPQRDDSSEDGGTVIPFPGSDRGHDAPGGGTGDDVDCDQLFQDILNALGRGDYVSATRLWAIYQELCEPGPEPDGGHRRPHPGSTPGDDECPQRKAA